MKKTSTLVLRIILWGALILLGLFVILNVSIALRYSPQYVYREIFMNMGNVYDYRILPERTLTASPIPFSFAENKSMETQVKAAFQSNSEIKDLDTFLADTGTQAFLVIRNDTIVYERYFKGNQRNSIVTSFSVAKSFDSALVGIAINEGYIKV